MDSMRRNAQKMMPHVMALNKKPSTGLKNNNQPARGMSNVTAYGKGGEAKKTVREMLTDPDRLQENMDLVAGFSGATGAPRLSRSAKKTVAAREAGYKAKNAEMESAKPSLASKASDRIADFKKFITDIGRPSDYRDSTSVKTGRKVVENSGKIAGATGAAAGATLAASTMKPSPKVKKPDSAKESDYQIDIADDVDSPKNDDINIKETRSSETLKKGAPAPAAKKPVESSEDAVARYNRLHGGDEETQAKIKADFTSGPAEYAKGGGVKDKKQDRALMERHNKLMHPGQKSKLAKGGKAKNGDKKKVMGTVGEANALMSALKKVRRPATPMPGTRMAGLGMAPPMAPQMAPPMKRGGKVMKRAAGGAAKMRRSSPKPDKIKKVPYVNGG